MTSSSIHPPQPSWQEKLKAHCKSHSLPPPDFHLMSDPRGGRTAWSCVVMIGNYFTFQAKFYYSGHYNAFEDAAEVAYNYLTGGGAGGSTHRWVYSATSSSSGSGEYAAIPATASPTAGATAAGAGGLSSGGGAGGGFVQQAAGVGLGVKGRAKY